MEENQKKLIDEKTVGSIRGSKTAGFVFILAVLGLTILLGMIFVPFPGNLIVLLVCGGIMTFVIVHRVRHGKLNVYFKEISVTDKWSRYYDSEDGGATTRYYLVFGDQTKEVPEKEYNKTNIGDRFYASYDEKNDRMIEMYDANEYELSPRLDIR